MAEDRHLDWDGCFNVRDLGGLPTDDGRVTRRGAVIRADALDDLTAAGWAALLDHGVRTVVDLRDASERAAGGAARPAGIRTLHRPLDATEDRTFWDVWGRGPQFGTPLYFRPHLERFPERTAAVVRAVARAAPGGVVIHCAGGRDRAGQIAVVLLRLAGVAPPVIAADYALSAGRLRARSALRGEADQGPLLEAFLAARGTTSENAVVATLDGFDMEAHLRGAGLDAADIAALRGRLVGDGPGGQRPVPAPPAALPAGGGTPPPVPAPSR